MPHLPHRLPVRGFRRRWSVGLAASSVAIVAVVALSGCVGGTSRSTSSPTGSATPSPSTTASTPTTVELHPDGSAQENLPFFDKVNRATLAAKPNAVGRDFIDALVAAGFDKQNMQLTVDTTTIGLKANSIQFSVRMGDTCLIGQNGADAGGYNSQVTPVLATGACLIGETRPIDW